MTTLSTSLPIPAFNDEKHHLRIYQSDCLALMAQLPASSVDLIFADPPYFLSNGGITCHAGKMVSVNKGSWDKLPGSDSGPARARFDEVHAFNAAWLAACQRLLKPNGSLWVSGTAHVIHSVGFAMQQLGFKLLNDISWVKPNPPPNLSCRYFTHATETIIWAAKDKKSRHTFHYKLMKETNRGKQMKSVWTDIRPPEPWEKKFGKHPTQKPVALLERILLASSNEGDLVLDPFSGGGTTLLTAFRLRRRAIGCELSAEFVSLTLRRICSELAQLEISVGCLQFSVDPHCDSVDRSCSAVPLGRHLCAAQGISTHTCPVNSNSSSKNSASISSAAPTVASSSPSKPTPSTTPAKNSAPPAAPTPTPSSSSKPKPPSTSLNHQLAAPARRHFERSEKSLLLFSRSGMI